LDNIHHLVTEKKSADISTTEDALLKLLTHFLFRYWLHIADRASLPVHPFREAEIQAEVNEEV